MHPEQKFWQACNHTIWFMGGATQCSVSLYQVSAFAGGGGHGADVIAQWRHQQVPARAIRLHTSALLVVRVCCADLPPSQRPPSGVSLSFSWPRSAPDGGTRRSDVTHCIAFHWRQRWRQ